MGGGLILELPVFTPVAGLEAVLLNQRRSLSADPEVKLPIVLVFSPLNPSPTPHAGVVPFSGSPCFLFQSSHAETKIPVFSGAIMMIFTVV